MTVSDAVDAPQPSSEGESLDGSDKPPLGDLSSPSPRLSKSPIPQNKPHPNGSSNAKRTTPALSVPSSPRKHDPAYPASGPHLPLAPSHSTSIPLPPPDAKSHRKEPGHTVDSLKKLVLPVANGSVSTPGSTTPSPADSPSPTESGGWSLPSTRPPSQAPSRAPSMSGPKPDNASLLKVTPHAFQKLSKKGAHTPLAPATPVEPPRPKGPPSVHSDTGGHKFTLKELLASGPKLARKSSARSTASSKKSDSEGGGARSTTGGESTVSLLKKYGTCERVAIGKGATSVVRLAHKWDRTEEKLYAVKEFRKRRKNETEKEYVKKLTAEFCISSTLHHINVVETVDLVQDENQHWCEVMEFCPGGDLYAAIKKGHMSPSEIECCFKQILCGVSYLHSQGVAHRDIKPENLFFDTKGHLKIGDYGASTVYRLPWEATIHMSTGLCGSEPYIAPEQFLNKPYDARLVDIWAVGVVYYCLYFQELPWRVAQQTDALYAAYTAACANPQQTACPPTINNLSPRMCRPLIRRMLEPDPKQRALIEECMQHAWTQSIEVCHAVPSPAHVHVHAQSLAQAQVQAL